MPECPTCSEDKFQTLSGMRQHHTRVHGEKLPNKTCKECDKDFYYDGQKKLCESCEEELRSIRDVPEGIEMNQEEWESLSHYQRHYYENREKEISRSTERKKELREWFTNYKKSLECEECGENRYYCLDFHHEHGEKEFNLGSGVTDKYGKKRILEEIEKCIVLCANCHREHHYG